MVTQLAQEHPLALVARVVGCSRSTLYAPARPRPTPAALQTALLEVVAKWPTYGYRRITAELRRRGGWVGHNRVQRLLRTLGLTHVSSRRGVHTTDSKHPFPRYPNRVTGLAAVRPDQVWVGEIVFTQMTKTDVLAARVGRDDITNFDLGIRHDNPVDQKLDQLTLLFEGGIYSGPRKMDQGLR